MSQARIDRQVEIMNANKLRYSKNYARIYGIGFNDSAMAHLCKEIVDEIEKILVAGVNYGFSPNMKKAVSDLTAVAQKTCSDGFVKVKIDGLYAKKNACINTLVLPDAEGEGNIRENFMAYVASAKNGMGVMRDGGYTKTKAEIGYEGNCEKLLDDIAKAAESVIDFSSPDAVEKYNSILTKLRVWRESIARSNGFYDSNTVSPLRDVLAETKKWAMLYRTPVKRAEASEIFPIPEDDLTRVIESEKTCQSILMFLGRCDDYVYAVYEMSRNGVAETVREIRTSLAEARAEQQKLENDRNRGRVSQADYDYYSKRIQNDIDRMEMDLSRVQLDEVSRRELQLRREMISRIEQPIRSSYNYAKNNRIHVHKLFADMDFSRIIALLNNNLGAREMEDGISDIQNTLIARGFIDKQGQVLYENIKSRLGEEYDSAWQKN
jgi:hypothetical protein